MPKKQLWKFFLHALEKLMEYCGNGCLKDLAECMLFWEVTINFNFLTIYFLSMVVDLSQSLFSWVSFGNLNVLEQWFSNFLVLGTLYMLKSQELLFMWFISSYFFQLTLLYPWFPVHSLMNSRVEEQDSWVKTMHQKSQK